MSGVFRPPIVSQPLVLQRCMERWASLSLSDRRKMVIQAKFSYLVRSWGVISCIDWYLTLTEMIELMQNLLKRILIQSKTGLFLLANERLTHLMESVYSNVGTNRKIIEIYFISTSNYNPSENALMSRVGILLKSLHDTFLLFALVPSPLKTWGWMLLILALLSQMILAMETFLISFSCFVDSIVL